MNDFSNSLQDKSMHLSGDLIEFSGVDFRNNPVSCPVCSWQGSAGELRVPYSAATDNSIVYTCPSCSEQIARHAGLNTVEVLHELEKIQQLLAAELAGTRSLPEESETSAELPATKLSTDFATVRAQLPSDNDVAGEASSANPDVLEDLEDLEAVFDTSLRHQRDLL